ncbi:restriction endonuclease subunit S domain-containing protein [Spirochaeta dissipatitropha]
MQTAILTSNTISILEQIQTTAIAKAATLLRPPLIKEETDAKMRSTGKEYYVASMTDFPNTGYLCSLDRQITIEEQLDIAYKYAIQANDVLISIVGSIGHVGIVPPDFKEAAVPSSNILIVRLHESSPEKAILAGMFYKSRPGQEILRDLTHGKTIPLISKKAFAATPFPEANEQNIQAAISLFDKEILAEQKCSQLHKDIENARATFLIQFNEQYPQN